MQSSSEHATSPDSSAAPRPRSRELWGGPWVALLGVLAGAAALRVVGIRYGLPFGNLLNPDEQSIVPRAWKMVHGGGWDPHWFDYPTGVLDTIAPFETWQAHPSYLTGRIVVLALGLGSIAGTWWLARRAWGTNVHGALAAITLAVSPLHVAYSRMAVTDVPLTFGVAGSLALMLRGPLELAGAAAGIATGFKYPGIFLAVPLVVAGWGRRRRLAQAFVALALGFFATSPFVLVHPGQAWHDAWRVQRLARDGWLGFEQDHSSPVAFSALVWHALGPVLAIALAGAAVALVRRSRADLVLVSFSLVYFLDLLTVHAHFDRYVLPLLPPLAALAARFRWLGAVTLLLLAVPLTWTVRDDKRLTRTDTRVVAAREIHVPEGSLVAADPSTPPLRGVRILPLSLPGPGRPFDPNRSLVRLRARGVRYVLLTGAVTDRVLAARDRYPREARFYDEVRALPRPYYLAPGDGRFGPWVGLYELGP